MDVSFAIGAKNNTGNAFASVSKGLEGIGNSAKFATGLLGGLMGIGSALAFFEMGKSTIEAGDQLAKLNSKLGMSVEALSQYKYIAKLSGVEFEGFTNGVKHMERGISEAASGTGAALPAFNRLGLNIQQLRAMKPDQQFEAIAEAMTNIKDPTDRTNLAMDIFGKTGTELLPMLEDGAKGLKNMRTEADQLGLTMSTAKAKGFEALNDSMERFTTTIGGAFKGIIAEFAPMLTAALDFSTRLAVAFKRGIGTAIQWVKDKISELGESALFQNFMADVAAVGNFIWSCFQSVAGWWKYLSDVFSAVGWQIYDIFKSLFTALAGWLQGSSTGFKEWIRQITGTSDALVGLGKFGLFAVVKGVQLLMNAVAGLAILWNRLGWAAAKMMELMLTGLQKITDAAYILGVVEDETHVRMTNALFQFKLFQQDIIKSQNAGLDETLAKWSGIDDQFDSILTKIAGMAGGSASLDFEWDKLLPKFNFAKNTTGDIKNNIFPIPAAARSFTAALEPAIAMSGEIADNLDRADQAMTGMSAVPDTFASQEKTRGMPASQKDVNDVNALLDKMFPGRNIQSPFMPRMQPEVTVRDANGVINLTLNVNSATLDQRGVDTLAKQMYSSLGRLKDRIS